MPFCPNCGSNAEGRFCAKCGTPIPASATSAGPPPPPPPPDYGQAQSAPPPPGYVPPAAPYAAASGLQENIAGALCYLPFVGWIIAIVFLAIDPYKQNRNVKFHAFQSIFLFVALLVVWIVLRTAAGLMFMSFSFGILVTMIMLFFDLAVLVVLLFLMYKAYNNQRFVLPIIGPLAEKQA